MILCSCSISFWIIMFDNFSQSSVERDTEKLWICKWQLMKNSSCHMQMNFHIEYSPGTVCCIVTTASAASSSNGRCSLVHCGQDRTMQVHHRNRTMLCWELRALESTKRARAHHKHHIKCFSSSNNAMRRLLFHKRHIHFVLGAPINGTGQQSYVLCYLDCCCRFCPLDHIIKDEISTQEHTQTGENMPKMPVAVCVCERER